MPLTSASPTYADTRPSSTASSVVQEVVRRRQAGLFVVANRDEAFLDALATLAESHGRYDALRVVDLSGRPSPYAAGSPRPRPSDGVGERARTAILRALPYVLMGAFGPVGAAPFPFAAGNGRESGRPSTRMPSSPYGRRLADPEFTLVLGEIERTQRALSTAVKNLLEPRHSEAVATVKDRLERGAYPEEALASAVRTPAQIDSLFEDYLAVSSTVDAAQVAANGRPSRARMERAQALIEGPSVTLARTGNDLLGRRLLEDRDTFDMDTPTNVVTSMERRFEEVRGTLATLVA